MRIISGIDKILIFTLLALACFSVYSQEKDIEQYLKEEDSLSMADLEKPVPLPRTINSKFEESIPIVSSDGTGLFFVRSLDPQNVGGVNGGHDIYMSSKTSYSDWSDATNDFELLNDEGNNSVIGISKDGQRMYTMHSKVENDERITKIKRYTWDPDNSQWINPELMKIPGLDFQGIYYGGFVNEDEDVMIFSAKMDDSKGEEDLYVTLKDYNDNWSKVAHMGDSINSEGYEMAPFLSNDRSILYFTSNKFDTKGDADIFYSYRLIDTSYVHWSSPKNLDRFNTTAFDAYLTLNSDETEAYFVSNRAGDMSDIYMAKIRSVFPETRDTVGIAADFPKEMPETERIFFDFSRYDLQPEEKVKIDSVAKILNEYEALKIEILGHTDSVGSVEANQVLSLKRSNTVRTKLIADGIDKSRIFVDYHGESKPIATNETDKGRALNRRVDLIFIRTR